LAGESVEFRRLAFTHQPINKTTINHCLLQETNKSKQYKDFAQKAQKHVPHEAAMNLVIENNRKLPNAS
jgi:hypothetical protein